MAKLNRVCGICKTKYSYCPTCAADANKPTWMAVFCSENCREVYNVLNDCRYHSLSKKDAFNKLSALHLSCASTLPVYFKETLNEILEEGKTKEVIEEVIVEEIMNAPISMEEQAIEKDVIKNEIVEAEVVKEEPLRNKKRNYNKKANVIEKTENE